jgi:hypothetical protein
MKRGLGFLAVLAAVVSAMMIGAGAGSAATQRTSGLIDINPCSILPYLCYENYVFCVEGVTVHPSDPAQALYLSIWAGVPGSGVTAGACEAGPTPPEPQGPDRYIYCAAAGNTDVNGNPLGAGQTLNLEFGQPNVDKHYAGATLGFWVQGVGLTCQLTPAQAALAAASTTKVNHTGAANTQEGAQVYTFVPATA